MRILLGLLLALPVTVAVAQTAPDGVLTPAPVPGVGPGTVSPSDRAGRTDGVDRGTPFSGLPNTTRSDGGQPTPTTLGDPSRGDTAPSPALGR